MPPPPPSSAHWEAWRFFAAGEAFLILDASQQPNRPCEAGSRDDAGAFTEDSRRSTYPENHITEFIPKHCTKVIEATYRTRLPIGNEAKQTNGKNTLVITRIHLQNCEHVHFLSISSMIYHEISPPLLPNIVQLDSVTTTHPAGERSGSPCGYFETSMGGILRLTRDGSAGNFTSVNPRGIDRAETRVLEHPVERCLR